MQIVVISDTHGSMKSLEDIYKNQPNADVYIHLGDGYEQVRRMRAKYPLMPLLAVRGNCDIGESDSDCKFLDLCGRHIMYTHGHRFGVKMGMSMLRHEAQKQKADIVCFGHTHEQLYEEYGGIHFLNPGSAASYGTEYFAIIDISEDGQIHVSLNGLPV
ncbi:MAG: metallophosphoesterase [Oscillospiraceae bacterium]